MSERQQKTRFFHETLNSIVATAGLLLASMSLGIQLTDRVQEDRESVEVEPSVGTDHVTVGIANTSRKDIWLRWIRIEFVDDLGDILRDAAIQVKPPPEGAMQLAPKQVEVFSVTFNDRQVPDEALCAQIVVGTTLGFLTDYYVTADLFRSPSRWRRIPCPREARE
ncbi:MAG TPA: hypothetical protein VF017_05355 [Thermoanaerobaculia bacterium]|nr:hypothetical protein [Thermoanaerobaculia bacterium]